MATATRRRRRRDEDEEEGDGQGEGEGDVEGDDDGKDDGEDDGEDEEDDDQDDDVSDDDDGDRARGWRRLACLAPLRAHHPMAGLTGGLAEGLGYVCHGGLRRGVPEDCYCQRQHGSVSCRKQDQYINIRGGW